MDRSLTITKEFGPDWNIIFAMSLPIAQPTKPEGRIAH
jgi:hypothetical protein